MFKFLFPEWENFQLADYQYRLILPDWSVGVSGQYAVLNIIKTLKPVKIAILDSKYFYGTTGGLEEDGHVSNICEVYCCTEKKLLILSHKTQVRPAMFKEFVDKLIEFIEQIDFYRVIYLTSVSSTDIPKTGSDTKLFTWCNIMGTEKEIEDILMKAPTAPINSTSTYLSYLKQENNPAKLETEYFQGPTNILLRRIKSEVCIPFVVLAKRSGGIGDLDPAVELALAAFRCLKFPETDWAVRNLKNLQADSRIEDFQYSAPLSEDSILY